MLLLSLRALRRPSVVQLACRVRYYSVPVDVPGSSKVWGADEAVKDVKSGDILLCGGVYTDFLCSDSPSNAFHGVGFGQAGLPGMAYPVSQRRPADLISPQKHYSMPLQSAKKSMT
jgi:hypothetical protein